MRYLALIGCLLFVLPLAAQEKLILYKGKKGRSAPIVEPRDTAGIDPFRGAKRVELLYYKSDRMAWWYRTAWQEVELIGQGRLNFPVDSIARRVQLDAAQTEDWRATCYEEQLCEEMLVAGCYQPRHLLLFYDERDAVIGGIEICISCAGGWLSPGLRRVVFCPERTAALAALIHNLDR